MSLLTGVESNLKRLKQIPDLSLALPWVGTAYSEQSASVTYRRFVSDADYVKKFAVTRSDLLAAWGMGLIIVGVAFFLLRDLRRRFEQIDLFFDQLEGRFRYVPFIAPASALLGFFLILLAFVF